MGKWHFFQILLKFKYEDITTASWNTSRLLITTPSLKKRCNWYRSPTLILSCGMKKGAFWPNFTLFGHFIIFVIRMGIYKFLKLGRFTEHTISFAKKMKLLYVIYLILNCDMRKGHFLPKFGKKYSFIKIYTWRNNYKFQKLCQVIDYNILFKKMRNLIYGYMLLFSCGMKKGHFPPNLVKNTMFCPYICALAYGEANMDTWNLFKHQITVYFYSK